MIAVSRFIRSAMMAISDEALLAQCTLQALKTNMDAISAQKRMKLPITGRIAEIFANASDCHDNGCFVDNFRALGQIGFLSRAP